jgi:hypothetical protein
MAKKAKKAEGALLSVSAKVRAIAGELMQSALLLEELRGDYFGDVRSAIVGGATFEELEQCEPDLKKIQAYRSAKSAIKQAKENGISLFNADGSPKGRTALEKDVKAAKKAAAGDGDGEGETASSAGANAKYVFGDVHSLLVKALAIFATEPTMRKAYSTDIMGIARALANDEAKSMTPKARTMRVSPQRGKLAEAAAKAQQVEQVEPVAQAA